MRRLIGICQKAICFSLILTLLPLGASAGSVRDTALNDPVMGLLESLVSHQLIDDVLFGIRPLFRSEADRLILQARENYRSRASGHRVFSPDMDRSLIQATRAALRRREAGKFYLQPVESFRAETFYYSGEPTEVPGRNISASQHSLFYNQEGVVPENGLNIVLRVSLEGQLGPLGLMIEPLWHSAGSHVRSTLHQASLRWTMRAFTLEWGKRTLWWGQGYHGGLFLTTNAPPLQVLRLTNTQPALLPWFFRHLGPFRFDFVVSRLEKEREIPEPYWGGLRVNFRPHPQLEMGLTRTAILSGDGRPAITLSSLWDVLFGENKRAPEDLSDSIAGLDFRWSFSGGHIYGELGGEDEAGMLPSKAAWLTGVHLLNVLDGVDLRIEYADITSPVWYRHQVYKTGYTYQGHVLGHHAGGSARDLFLQCEIGRGTPLSAIVRIDYEERGVGIHPDPERHYQVGTEWAIEMPLHRFEWTMKIAAAYERIENVNFSVDTHRNDTLVHLSLTGWI